jgi:hypothetical protein
MTPPTDISETGRKGTQLLKYRAARSPATFRRIKRRGLISCPCLSSGGRYAFHLFIRSEFGCGSYFLHFFDFFIFSRYFYFRRGAGGILCP